MSSATQKRYISTACLVISDLYQKAVIQGMKEHHRPLEFQMPMGKTEVQKSKDYLEYELNEVKKMMLEDANNYPYGALPADDRTRAGHLRHIVSAMCLYLQTVFAYRLEKGPMVVGLSKVGLECMKIFFSNASELCEQSLFHRRDHAFTLFYLDAIAECGVRKVINDFAEASMPEISVQALHMRKVAHLSSGSADVLSIEMHRHARLSK